MAATRHTIVLGDLHLCEAEAPDPDRPLWKRFKHTDLFSDEAFARMLAALQAEVGQGAELILNGDVFDFDGVCGLPESAAFSISWLERLRGLDAEEEKSAWKMARIVRDHPVWFDALQGWLAAGHEVVVVIGNHDLELHWPMAQEVLTERVGELRFCEVLAVSGGDTLVMHGNQMDPYCLCMNPVEPLIRVGKRVRVRLPFGNLAGRTMLNRMGLFNPHVEASFIKPAAEYLRFFVREVARVQPLLGWTWLWTAVTTLASTLREGFRPALKRPLEREARVDDMASRARCTPGVLRTVLALSVHPAVLNPWKIARELWLDRALLLALAVWAALHVSVALDWLIDIPPWWGALAFCALLPPYLIYAWTVRSDVDEVERNIDRRVPQAALAAGVKRVVLGHTHHERHEDVNGVEILNPGTWSAAYEDVACTRRLGRRCFVWLRPGDDGRDARVVAWQDPGFDVLPRTETRRRGILAHIPRPVGSLFD